MIDAGRYTSGRIAVANLSVSIDILDRGRIQGATFGDLVALANLLFLRGDLLGRIADHDRGERIAAEAIALEPASARALYEGARLAQRFHRFEQADASAQIGIVIEVIMGSPLEKRRRRKLGHSIEICDGAQVPAIANTADP